VLAPEKASLGFFFFFLFVCEIKLKPVKRLVNLKKRGGKFTLPPDLPSLLQSPPKFKNSQACERNSIQVKESCS
jgi:hypothetical protein